MIFLILHIEKKCKLESPKQNKTQWACLRNLIRYFENRYLNRVAIFPANNFWAGISEFSFQKF